MSRIKPNDLCVIIGEDPGCECNIGALLTVKRIIEGHNGRESWTFVEASRPLKMINIPNFPSVGWVVDSYPREFPGMVFPMPDKYLIPIPPKQLVEQREVETQS